MLTGAQYRSCPAFIDRLDLECYLGPGTGYVDYYAMIRRVTRRRGRVWQVAARRSPVYLRCRFIVRGPATCDVFSYAFDLETWNDREDACDDSPHNAYIIASSAIRKACFFMVQ